MGLNENNMNRITPKLGKIQDINGNHIGFQISSNGGSINLSLGLVNENGFYVSVFGTEGILKVKLWSSDEYVSLPFYKGWNPVLIKEVKSDVENTATNVYWGY